jgi:hypothetical protein
MPYDLERTSLTAAVQISGAASNSDEQARWRTLSHKRADF